MTSEEKAALVLSDPDALWAVLRAGVKVAGPWVRGETAGCRRARWVDEDGNSNSVAIAFADLSGAGAWVGGVEDASSEPLQTRAAAESWVDARLRESGWLLVETPA